MDGLASCTKENGSAAVIRVRITRQAMSPSTLYTEILYGMFTTLRRHGLSLKAPLGITTKISN